MIYCFLDLGELLLEILFEIGRESVDTFLKFGVLFFKDIEDYCVVGDLFLFYLQNFVNTYFYFRIFLGILTIEFLDFLADFCVDTLKLFFQFSELFLDILIT
jgi:hypothetical protein